MQTIGERLEEARKRKGISIREAAESTKIRGDYLQKFESNQFDLGLAEIYVRGFLRTYAGFLKLPAEKIVNDFNGLGLSANGRQRTPSREVYGRMDISVASAEEAAAAEGAPAASAPAEPTPAPARRTGSFTRGGGTGMPAGPAIDPNLVFKGGLVAAGLVVLVLIVWGISSLIRGRDDAPPASPASQVQSGELTFTLVALDRIERVTVARKSTGEIVFQGPLARGQRHSLPWPEAMLITASTGENLELEVYGRRTPSSIVGYGQAELPAPAR